MLQFCNVRQAPTSTHNGLGIPVPCVDTAVWPVLQLHREQRAARPACALHLRLQSEARAIPTAQGVLLRQVHLLVLSTQGQRSARVG